MNTLSPLLLSLLTDKPHIILQAGEVGLPILIYRYVTTVIGGHVLLCESAVVQAVHHIGDDAPVPPAAPLVDDGEELPALCTPASAVALPSEVYVIT